MSLTSGGSSGARWDGEAVDSVAYGEEVGPEFVHVVADTRAGSEGGVELSLHGASRFRGASVHAAIGTRAVDPLDEPEALGAAERFERGEHGELNSVVLVRRVGLELIEDRLTYCR
jgi:hypothetical protein